MGQEARVFLNYRAQCWAAMSTPCLYLKYLFVLSSIQGLGEWFLKVES